MSAIPSRVTAAEFVRHFGEWQDRAAAGPIAITHHGRDRLVAMSATSYRALSQIADPAPDAPSAIDETLVSRLSEGLILWDRELRIVTVSRVAAACLQISERDVIGTRVSLDPTLCSHLLRTMRTGEEAMFEARAPASGMRWLRFRCFPYLQGAACLFRDVTDEHMARERLADEAVLADALAAHGRIGRARLSPRGTLAEVERPFAALTGFEVEALVRTRLVDLLALERRALAAGHLDDVLTGGAARAFDSSLLMRGGGQRPARIALAGNDGGAIAIVTAE